MWGPFFFLDTFGIPYQPTNFKRWDQVRGVAFWIPGEKCQVAQNLLWFPHYIAEIGLFIPVLSLIIIIKKYNWSIL